LVADFVSERRNIMGDKTPKRPPKVKKAKPAPQAPAKGS
jgi:hypothetical protein